MTLRRSRPFDALGRVLAITFVMLLPSAGRAIAGQQDTSIIGQVTDESGLVLPGVTVTATSPALQVPTVTVITGEQGEYRLTPLPIGAYSVEYSLAGFETVRREGVLLTGGFVAKVDVLLRVGGLAETITVVGGSPVVDVTSTASVTRLTKETLEIVPTSRNGVIGLMAQAPGVRPNLDVGGDTMTNVPTFHAFGQDNEPWIRVEGVVTSTPKANTQGGSYWDYSALEEAQVQTFGSPAEFPTRGIQVNAVLKSGGNDFHGGGLFAITNRHLQSDNVDAALTAQGITSGNPVDIRSDVGAELGGRILRNKLWFYGSVRRRDETQEVLQCFQPDRSPCTEVQMQGFHTKKVSYQVNPSNRLVAFHQFSRKNQTSGATRLVSWESRVQSKIGSHVGKAEWQTIRGNAFVASVQFGYMGFSTVHPGFSTKIAATDMTTGVVTGTGVTSSQNVLEYRYQPKASLSWYVPNLFLGNHDFKTGVEYLRSRADRPWVSRGEAGNYQLIFRNGEAFQISAFNYPVEPLDLMRYFNTFVQDSWTVARRLTLNLGVRYARDNGFAPAQCRAAADPPSNVIAPAQCFEKVQLKIWNVVVPRLHASYNVAGDGKTVIKGGWGRFARMRYAEDVQLHNRNVATSTTYVWHDLNANKTYEPGEVDLAPNGADFLTTTLQGANAALANGIPNPNEQEPMSDEFSASIERELMPNFAVRATAIYSRTLHTYRLQNNLRPYGIYTIPITNRDPGPDGRAGTPDDPGTSITYYDYPAAYAGAAFQQPMLVNDDSANSTYKSFEIATSKRLANRWTFMASYSATKKHIPLVPNAGGGLSVLVSTFDPNAEINTSDDTWESLGRLSAASVFPWELLFSASYEYRSGASYARRVNFAGGKQIPSITLNVDPYTNRLPRIELVNLSLQKTVALVKSRKVMVRLNLFNALNSNVVTAQTSLSGPNYGKATSILLPRILEVSASYTF